MPTGDTGRSIEGGTQKEGIAVMDHTPDVRSDRIY